MQYVTNVTKTKDTEIATAEQIKSWTVC